MSFPSPIVPVKTVAASETRAASVAPRLDLLHDEGLVEGAVRRARQFAADMQIQEQRLPWLLIGLLTPLLMYSYWPGLLNARTSWDNPQYQHGWIVPLFTVLLLFWWRQPVGAVTTSARLAGIGLMTASFALRLFCASYRIVTIDMYTFVPVLIGLFLLAGGWSMFRWSWAPLAALIFMYPLPDEATRYLHGPLQTLATILSTNALQTLGFDAYRDGNRIILGDGQVLGVVDACSGLKMLTIFVWLAAMLIMVGGLEWWENVMIAASAIPIALVVNAVRITTVGVMYEYNSELAEGFHDSLPAALLMMVLAVGFLALEMKLLSWLVLTENVAPTVIATASQRPLAATRATPGPGPVRVPGAFPMLPGVKTRDFGGDSAEGGDQRNLG
jgi:exosortase